MSPISWNDILKQTYEQQQSRRHSPSTRAIQLIVLGKSQSGKRTLVRQLLGKTLHPNSITDLALSYTFETLSRNPLAAGADEEDEDSVACGVYILSEQSAYLHLLPSLLNQDPLHTMVVIVLDGAKPHTWMEQLVYWLKQVKHVSHQWSASELQERQDYVRQWILDHQDGRLNVQVSTAELQPTLSEGCLLENLGIPIAVVCSKMDSMSQWEKDYGMKDKHLDFIQQALRVQCLRYGALLCYHQENDDRIPKYLRHYLRYRFGITTETDSLPGANVVDRAHLWIPIGWDSIGKIKLLGDGIDVAAFQTEDESIAAYATEIKPPVTISKRAPLIPCEDEQQFLSRHVDLIGTSDVPISSTVSRPALHETTSKSSTNLSTTKPPTDTEATPASTQNQVLANFFQSLLKKSTSQPLNATVDPTATSRSAIKAELDKLKSHPGES